MKLKKKLVTSDCGAVVSEDMARHLDSLKKDLPQECTFRRKGAIGEGLTLDPGSRTDVSTITNTAVDRDFEIVDPKGIDLSHYRLNPVVLYGHSSDRPCGKALWVKETPAGITAKSYYPARPDKHQGEWLPDFVWGMIQADVLRGKSIGFLPLELREPTEEESQKGAKLVISKSLLCEFSVVSVPSNPEALVQAISKGLKPETLGTTWKVLGKAKKKATPRTTRNSR